MTLDRLAGMLSATLSVGLLLARSNRLRRKINITMFDYAHQRALEVLGAPRAAVLVTNGPAGVQVGEFPCVALGLSLYLLVPQTSDHLFNLEYESTVTMLITRCELKGRAQIISRGAVNPDCDLLRNPAADWGAFLRVEIFQVQLRNDEGWGNRETIDL
jgi:hypothetical protein